MFTGFSNLYLLITEFEYNHRRFGTAGADKAVFSKERRPRPDFGPGFLTGFSVTVQRIVYPRLMSILDIVKKI